MENELIEKIVDKAEELEWNVDLESQENHSTGETETYAEFRKYSPAGEDFSFTVFYDDADDLARKVLDYSEEFDVDEHIEMWVEARRNGVSGVPSTRALCDDAEAIDTMVQELAAALMYAAGIWN